MLRIKSQELRVELINIYKEVLYYHYMCFRNFSYNDFMCNIFTSNIERPMTLENTFCIFFDVGLKHPNWTETKLKKQLKLKYLTTACFDHCWSEISY